MYDSSLCEVWEALVTFQQLIVLADSQGVVDMTHESIHRRTNIPLDIIQRGITELERVDTRSRSPLAEGRRLERLDQHRDWGWQIVNYQHYRNLATAEEKREADRKRIADKRAAERGDKPEVSQGVAVCREPSQVSGKVADVAHRDGDREAKEIRSPQVGFPKPEDEAGWKRLAKRLKVETAPGEDWNGFKQRIRRKAEGMGKVA
jgi:hypothetical protein